MMIVYLRYVFVFAAKPKKHELIIRENQPQELPPDVVRGIYERQRKQVNKISKLNENVCLFVLSAVALHNKNI